MIEGSIHESSTTGVSSSPSTSAVGSPQRLGFIEAQPSSVEMTSTMSTTTSGGDFRVDSDPPTLQIRDHRRGLTRGGGARDWSPGRRTPSPDTSVVSTERDVSPGMRMERRQKRRVIEEVAVYDSRTFYENLTPKRSRHGGGVDASPTPQPAPGVERHAVPVALPPTAVYVQPELTPSTSTSAVQPPSRTFAVTGSVEVPEDIVVEEHAAEVPRCIASVTVCPPSMISVTQDSGTNTSVTYVVHHSLPGKTAPGDTLVRRNDAPYRDLRTDLAESPSLDIKKKGKMRSGEYGPVLETVRYVVCYQVAGRDEGELNVINELHRPNYTITGRIGPTTSVEDTAESYTLTGLSGGGPPPYTEEQESLYLAILNYAARSQDDWQREVPATVSYITQQDFPKAIDSNTLSLSRKGPTIEVRESSPPPTPTPPCLLYTSPSPRDRTRSRMPSSA